MLRSAGYERTLDPEAAHVVLLNTCAIREGAEQRIWGRLGRFKVRHWVYHVQNCQKAIPMEGSQLPKR